MNFTIQRLDTQQADFESDFKALLDWDNRANPEIVQRVQQIVNAVREEGDNALIRFTREFDKRDVGVASDLVITNEIMEAAWHRLATSDRETLQTAANRIRTYHERQISQDSDYTDEFGNKLGNRTTPISRVGAYVPSGQASYPSTVLMTLIPAKIAGVPETIVAVPMPNGKVSDHILAALYLVEPRYAFGIGGAQAIAAMAFGTDIVPKVDKIVGPGGDWVAVAKKLVFGPVGIESIAGPSEILIIADGSVDPSWTAWDLMSQAEHDASAQAILVSPSSQYLADVGEQIEVNLTSSPRADIIKRSLEKRGAFIRTRSLDEAVEISNRVAPEHLQLALTNPRKHLSNIKHAGAIFLGQFSAEALGDYVAGPSHVLPTFGTARYASVLSVQDFTKRTSIIDITESGADALGRIASQLAEVEGLHAHSEAARVRLRDYDSNR
ncbi:MAG: histidinol dehydrogenase [Gammaproteobacteria bacterium]|nr:histidinol dehydrogenase [Gammaproteobacteria bacterium]